MDYDQLEVGALLQRIWTVIAAAPVAAVAYLLGLSALGTVIDGTAGETSGGYFLDSLASFVAGYFLFRNMLGRCGLLREGEGGGFGAFFGVSLLGGLGMLLGFVVLIIPGFVLMVRWQAATALAVCENQGATDALGASWEMTRKSSWQIFAVMVIGLVPAILVMAGLGAGIGFADVWAEGDTLSSSYAELIVINVVANAYSVFSTALPVAVYWMLRRELRDVSEVFA